MKLTKDQIFGIVRHSLTFIGGILIVKGGVNDAQWYEISGAAMSLLATVWSVLDKRAA